jgi:CheY-like chemotaxis protein
LITEQKRIRILVAEDEALIALMYQELLVSAGYEVIGPAGSVPAAMKLVKTAEIDGALLDVNLRGVFSFPVAEALRAKQVRYIFVTGYVDRQIIPADLANEPILIKPVSEASFYRAIADLSIGTMRPARNGSR